jgi:hypothetical protein
VSDTGLRGDRYSHGLGVPQSYQALKWHQKGGLPTNATRSRSSWLTGCLSPPAGSVCDLGAAGPTILLVEIKLTSALAR